MTKMNPKVKAAWVAALRSGVYQQGAGQLRNVYNDFCCYGVLCNLHALAHPKIASAQPYNTEYMGSSSLLPTGVERWAGIRSDTACVTIGGFLQPLFAHNDGNHCERRTFSEIADAIEAQL